MSEDDQQQRKAASRHHDQVSAPGIASGSRATLPRAAKWVVGIPLFKGAWLPPLVRPTSSIRRVSASGGTMAYL